MRRICIFMLAAMVSLVAPHLAYAQGSDPLPVKGLEAFDTPSDDGTSITLRWAGAGARPADVMRATSRDGEYEMVGEVLASDGTFRDSGVEAGVEYYYKLAFTIGDQSMMTEAAGPAAGISNWFRHGRVNTLLATIVMFALVAVYVTIARRGKKLYVRKIAGLNAIDEAVGRATEMGKKIFYIPGILSLSEIQTIASLSILKHVSKLTAIYGTSIEVPNKDPLVFSAARETVRQAYMEAGKPDQFQEDMVTYLTYDQFAYAASVTAKMVREKPATNFMIGSFFAESLILAETGQAAGAIQIAGTADVTQLPFFVTTCDYTLLGEELYAASAYLSREPVLLGSIKAQDTAKAILMVLMAAGIVLLAFKTEIVVRLLETH
jgi:hypothetical protein